MAYSFDPVLAWSSPGSLSRAPDSQVKDTVDVDRDSQVKDTVDMDRVSQVKDTVDMDRDSVLGAVVCAFRLQPAQPPKSLPPLGQSNPSLLGSAPCTPIA
jgi:hypothetical protein